MTTLNKNCSDSLQISTPSISSSATLVELGISKWTGRKLDKRASADVASANYASSGVANVHKKLLADCAELKAIDTLVGVARTTHYSMTMPWSDTGLRLLTTKAYFKYHETMTEIQAKCPTPQRCIIGHPFNPPYLLPLVEIVGGDQTDPEAVQWASAFYQIAGKSPLVMKKEIPGFVATRLQEALWREALHMVANGEASPADIDNALMNGPAPRMAVQGQCMAFHVACGEGGMATNLDQFGPALKLPWTRLEAPELTQGLRDRMVDGCNEIAGDQRFEEMAAKRDAQIVAVLRAIRDSD